VRDGAEPNPWNLDTDGDGLINALDPDSDGDGLLDGTELGVTPTRTPTRISARQLRARRRRGHHDHVRGARPTPTAAA
jgi:hypothetical protein